MKNYVLIYAIENEEAQEIFRREFVKRYPHFQTEYNNNVIYYGFSARELPEVHDNLHDILQRLSIGQNDYVAVYYTKKGDDDVLMREMMLGSASLVETKIGKIPADVFEDTVNKLLSINFNKLKSMQG
jgi:hypothetical protein